MQAFLIEDKVHTIKIVDHTMPICLIHKAGVDAIINTTRVEFCITDHYSVVERLSVISQNHVVVRALMVVRASSVEVGKKVWKWTNAHQSLASLKITPSELKPPDSRM